MTKKPDGNGSKDLTLDQKWVDGVFTKLSTLEVTLDPDPLVYGPKRLNSKVAEARNMLQQCEATFLQVSHDLHRFSRALRSAETKLKLSKDYLFTNDPETRAGRNVSDRESIASMKLADQVKEVHRLNMGVEDLKAVMDVVKAKRSDLRDIQGRLRDQIRLCQEEIGLGGRWGSRAPNAPDLDPHSSPRVEVDELDDLLSAVDRETHLPPAQEPEDDDEDVFAEEEEEEEEEEEAPEAETPFEEWPTNGLVCSACGEPQRETPHGSVCINGHGGAPGVTPKEWSRETEPEVDLGEVLEPTASEDEVDAFLEEEDEEPSGPESPERDLGLVEFLDESLVDLFGDDE